MADSKIVHLTHRKELRNFVNNHRIVLVKTSATWCGPCRAVQPLVNKLTNLLSNNIYVVHVDADEGSDILAAMKWNSVPTFCNFINGELQDILIGANADNIIKFFNKTIERSMLV